MSADLLSVAIALGSNVGDRLTLLCSAIADVGAMKGVTVRAETPVEETVALGDPQPAFLNQMVLIESSGTLPELLSKLQSIELRHGRVRTVPKGPRTLDIDIVWAQDQVVTSSDLLVPHPGLAERAFWQRELALLLGVDAARDAIDAARIHAGMDTSPRATVR